MRHQVIGDTLSEKLGAPCVQGKGGFFVKGQGFISLAKARKITGIEAPKRKPQMEALPWGDYATIVMLNKKVAAK